MSIPSALSEIVIGPVDKYAPKGDSIVEVLQEKFPYGHKGFIPQAVDMMRLHSEKNYDYARGGNALGNFDRVAAIFKQYPGLDLADPAIIAIVYMLKQLDAYLWMKCRQYEGKVETKDTRLGDVEVYAGLTRLIEQDKGEPHGSDSV